MFRRNMRRPKIVLIDDEKELVDILKRFFEVRRFDVSFAYGGHSGLELIRNERPDVVILDIAMFDMDGRDVLSEMKKDITVKHIPVVILSAKDDPYDEKLGNELGAACYIAKPYSSRHLLRTVKEVLKKNRTVK